MVIMEEKFVKDFLEAQEVDKEISRQAIDFVDGVFILKEMIKYVREDIKTLDVLAKKDLDKILDKLNEINVERKEVIKKRYKEPEDDEEKDFIHIKLLREDHEKYKKELFYIQSLGYRKGWFDLDAKQG